MASPRRLRFSPGPTGAWPGAARPAFPAGMAAAAGRAGACFSGVRPSEIGLDGRFPWAFDEDSSAQRVRAAPGTFVYVPRMPNDVARPPAKQAPAQPAASDHAPQDARREAPGHSAAGTSSHQSKMPTARPGTLQDLAPNFVGCHQLDARKHQAGGGHETPAGRHRGGHCACLRIAAPRTSIKRPYWLTPSSLGAAPRAATGMACAGDGFAYSNAGKALMAALVAPGRTKEPSFSCNCATGMATW